MNRLNHNEFITFKHSGDQISIIMYYEYNAIVDIIKSYRHKLDVVRIVHNLRKGLLNGRGLLYHKLMVEAVADHAGYDFYESKRYGK